MITMKIKLITLYLLLLILNTFGLDKLDPDFKGFDDSVLFRINWAGKNGITNEILEVPEFQQMTVRTENDEKYKCIIPQVEEKENHFKENNIGLNPLFFLSLLFKQSSCSHRLEAYWTYELCHGKYIRQYHEEREGKTVKLQEYYLGMWDDRQQEQLEQQLEEKIKVNDKVPIKKIEGFNMPYLQLNMTDGTYCDLSSKPRQTKVLYICYIQGKHEIYSLKETSICEYEVIVLSPILCNDPRYRSQAAKKHVINCHPIDNTPKKPKSLLQLEAESLKLRHQKTNDVSHLRVEIHPLERGEEEEESDLQSTTSMPFPFAVDTPADMTLNSFLSGSDCILGNFGWWKYEFCYGKYVIQYHVEKDGSKKTIINLGNFDKAAHLKWLQDNPNKSPTFNFFRNSVSHFYSGGTVCAITGKPRQTEVKLKCLDEKDSQGAVSLYLLEPKVCQYVLVVESKEICHLLTKIDENGLYEPSEGIKLNKASQKNDYQSDSKENEDKISKVAVEEQKVQVVNKEKEKKISDNLESKNNISDGDE